MAKNLNVVSKKLIEDKALLRLNMHISAIGYLEKSTFCFTKITGDDEEMIKDGRKTETISNSEKMSKKGFT